MTSFERFLMSLDTWPIGACLRIGLGICIAPLFRLIPGGDGRVWPALLLFLALLLALRLAPAVLRRVFAFSREAKDLWFERRNLGKRYDSYQWQKLLWIGLGMLPWAMTGRGAGTGELVVLAICLVGGTTGFVFWRRTGAARSGATSTRTPTPGAMAPARR